MNTSTPIVGSVEVIPLNSEDNSPLFTKVKVKVFHLGENRNKSYIDKPTALEMAKTLRGCPIVARYRDVKEDFTDHGEEITINDQGVNIAYMTKPYGFVDLNAKIWFEDYTDVDENGRDVVHTYVVTEGVVWTEQYEELKSTVVADGKRPQSMELQESSLRGSWAKVENSNDTFFIITDAIITKLCILGEDVEPCFIGSTVETLEDTENNEPVFHFTKNEEFAKTLYNKMQELIDALEGGQSMENENIEVAVVETPEAETVAEVGETVETEFVETEVNTVEEEAPVVEEETVNVDATLPEAEFEKKEEEEEKSEEEETKDEEKSDDSEEDDKKKEVTENACGDKKKKYSLLEEQYSELEAKYNALEEECKVLKEFKANIENEKKDAMIAEFNLSDEDKKDVIENKANYSLEEIESKLSIIYARKHMNLEKEQEAKSEEETVAPVTFNLDGGQVSLPDWFKAAKKNEI